MGNQSVITNLQCTACLSPYVFRTACSQGSYFTEEMHQLVTERMPSLEMARHRHLLTTLGRKEAEPWSQTLPAFLVLTAKY